MCVDYLWSKSPHQIDKRANHPWIGDGRVEWLLRIDIKPADSPAPAPNSMYRDFPVHLAARASWTCESNNFHIVTALNKFVRKHLHVEIPPTKKRRRVDVGCL